MSSVGVEWIKNSEGKRIYTVSHSKAIIRGNKTVDQDLTALENVTEEHQEQLDALEDVVKGNAWIILGKATYGGEITIPAIGWEEENNMYSLEIANSQITETTMPLVALSPESHAIAIACGLKSYCRTFEGKMKIYADSPPAAELVASISLVGENLLSGKGLKVNALTGAVGVDTNVVVTNDDMVDENEMKDDITDWLND